MTTIKVLVVDDSAFMRKMITEILSSDKRLQVVGYARNGKEALDKVTKMAPDVITLDVEMPVMDGIEMLEQLMKRSPLPVVMLSSLTKTGTEKTIQAISLGAVDFITKPSGSISLDITNIEHEIISKVVTASKARITPLVPLNATRRKNESEQAKPYPRKRKMVAIGTSTGGPRALQQVLTKLPKDFPAPIIIVQHMPQGFTHSLANRLDSLSELCVKEAVNGELLINGTAYIAPGGFHFGVRKMGRSLVADVFQSSSRNGHQPSVDVLLESISEQDLFQTYAVIMTGMGSDGSKGLHKLKTKRSDTVIISESSKTAVVYGMPQAAIKTELVDEVVDLGDISNVLLNRLCVGGKKNGSE